MRLESRSLALVVFLLAARWTHSAAAESPPEAVRDFVLQGMRVSREALKTGVCKIDLERRFVDHDRPELSESSSFNTTWTLGTDHRMRMEWVYPTAVAEASGFIRGGGVLPDPKPKTLTGYLLKGKDRNVEWFQGSQWVDVTAPSSPHLGWEDYFDVRAVGFYGWVELSRGMDWETLLDVVQKQPIARARVEAGDLYTLTWELGSKNSEWIVTVDAGRGFAPVKAEMRQRRNASVPWRTVQKFDSEWAQVSSVWLPVLYHGVDSQSETAVRDFKVTFSWKDVNVPIPDLAFTIESLNAPSSVFVVDSRLGVPVITKSPGDSLAAVDVTPARGFGIRRLSFLIFNILVVAMGAVYAGIRLRARKRGVR